jgi:hypothetical protein
LITRIYREFKKLNSQRINDPMKKWANEVKRVFSTKEVKMAKTPHNSCHKGNANQNHIKIPPHSY